MNFGDRLTDPSKKIPLELGKKCSEKIELAMAILAAAPNNGGNPLLFAIASGCNHVLLNDNDDEYYPCGKGFKTAATDGKKFYWHAKFLDAMSTLQTLTVLKHEAYHNLLLHPVQMRAVEYPKALNIAADFLVNSMIEREWTSNGKRLTDSDGNHLLWCEPLGKPITLAELKEVFMQDKQELLEKTAETVERIRNKKYDKAEQKPKEKPGDDVKLQYMLVDPSLLGRSAIDIYKEIKEWYSSLDGELKELLGEFLTDHHMPGEADREQAIRDLLRSVGFARTMRGDIPAEIEALLDELNDPVLDLSEFLDQSIKRTIMDGGNKASYVRFKRRFLGECMYFPKYMRSVPQILVLLDTSGSMSDRDIAAGTSELQQFAGKANIFIVPVDAEPHWNSITKVTKLSDFKHISVVGRGGTVFYDFFKDYKSKLRKYGHFDSIIVITDGMIDIIPPELRPTCDVGWVMTSPSEFQQSFGKPIYLQHPK